MTDALFCGQYSLLEYRVTIVVDLYVGIAKASDASHGSKVLAISQQCVSGIMGISSSTYVVKSAVLLHE